MKTKVASIERHTKVLQQLKPAAVEKSGNWRMASRTMMGIIGLQTLAMLGLSAVLVFDFYNIRVHDRFIAETGDGKAMFMTGLSEPNMSRETLSSWVADAAGRVMTFGFNDIDERFAESSRLFTPKGWEDFRKILVSSGVLKTLFGFQQIISSVPEGPPVLKREGLIGSGYSWDYEVPLLVTIRAGGESSTARKTVRMVIVRVPTAENPNAVGISEWYLQ